MSILNTVVSHSLLGYFHLTAELSVPVYSERSHQTAKIHVCKVCNISEKTTTEWTLGHSFVVAKVSIPRHVQAFIRRHCQPEDLVTLTEKQSAHPHHMKQGVGITPRDPRCTACALSNGFPDSILVGTTSFNKINGSSINVPENHTKQEKQVPKKVQMVTNTDTILYPGTVMIKLCYTAFTNGTMF